MIVTIKVLRLLSTKSKYFSIKNDKLLITPNGVNFSIFYQLLCQDLNLYSTRALQNRKLDKTTREYERNRLTGYAVGVGEKGWFTMLFELVSGIEITGYTTHEEDGNGTNATSVIIEEIVERSLK